MRKLLTLLLTGICLLLTQTLLAKPLVFCHEDKVDFPWRTSDRTGLDLDLIQLVSTDLHQPIILQSLPWARCAQMLQRNEVDGAIGASFVPERQVWGNYPMLKNGKPDSSKRLHVASYSLYLLKANNDQWDGKSLIVGPGQVGFQTGFSIGKLLQKLNVETYSDSPDPLSILRMLSLHRLRAAALQTTRADQLLTEHPELASVISRYPRPLEEKPYYLMLSKQLVAEDPALANKIWGAIARQRESKAYQLQYKKVMANVSQQ